MGISGEKTKDCATKEKSEIVKCIQQDLKKKGLEQPECLQLIRTKAGIYVYRGVYQGVPAVIKYYERKEDRREILNYCILKRQNIPTIQTLALGNATLVLEDLSVSTNWRLGLPEDLEDGDVAKCLARWYFSLHENGMGIPELADLYFEYDSITEENLRLLMGKLPQAADTFHFLLDNYETLHRLIQEPTCTLTYNDFYWTNFAVRKDKQVAMMFDYNLLGRGYRYSDIRNTMSLSLEAHKVFREEYDRLFFEKYGVLREEAENKERKIDEVVAPLYTLVIAFTKHDTFPTWAEEEKEAILNGKVLAKAKQWLEIISAFRE